MKEKIRNKKNDDLENNRPKNKKLNFEINGVSAKTMMLLGALSASTSTLAKSATEKTSVVADIPDAQDVGDEDIAQWKEMSPAEAQKFLDNLPPPLKKGEVCLSGQGDLDSPLAPLVNKLGEEVSADATSAANSLEKVSDLSDIIPIGAPEVFDDERTVPWKREVMRNHILKKEGGGNYSFFGAEVNGEKKLFAMTASHVIGNRPVGDDARVGGDLFGFQTNGGEVWFDGIIKGMIGPGDHESTNNKFSLIEITRYWGIDGGELDAGEDDYKTLRTFPLASEPIDPDNPGFIGSFTQSGNWNAGSNPIHGYDPDLVGRWVSTINRDPTGTENSLTKMIMPDPDDPIYGGKTILVPQEVFHMDSTNLAFGSSGGVKSQIKDPDLTDEEMIDENADTALTRDIVEDYRILGSIQGITHPDNNEGVLATGVTLVQPYRAEIEAAIGGTLLDEAWDLEISGTGVTREVGRVVDIISSVEEIDAPIPEGHVLDQNYPNPFNPETRIRFAIPESEKVTLEVFNLLGQKVATLIDGEEMYTGTYEETFNAREYNLASGVYFYRLTAGKFSQTGKMTLMK